MNTSVNKAVSQSLAQSLGQSYNFSVIQSFPLFHARDKTTNIFIS